MNANEFRLGNYLNSGKVTSLEGSNNCIEIDGKWYKRNYVRPIKTTNEWLIKFGFKQDKECQHPNALSIRIPFGWLVVSFDMDFVAICNGNGGTYYTSTGVVRYVHRLQNLYHSLTLNELTTL